MLVKELLTVLDTIAPFSLQEHYDNSGLQVGKPDQEVSRGLVCLDVTPDVMTEALDKGCDLILSHHPLIFKGMTSLTGESMVEQVVMDAIRNNMVIVSLHTSLDNSFSGVNRRLAETLSLEQLQILQPVQEVLKKLVVFCPTGHAEKVRAAIFKAGAGYIGDYDCCSFNLEGQGSFRAGEDASPFVGNIQELHYESETRIETVFPSFLRQGVIAAMIESHPYEEVAYDVYSLENSYEKAGAGMVGELLEPLPPEAFLDMVKQRLKSSCLRHTPITSQEPVQRVAVCGGSGAFLISNAIKSGAQAFITGDVKYHQFLDAKDQILLVDAGHYETEQYTKALMVDIIQKKIINFALLISEVNTNPLNYR